ncbi:septin-2-like [Dysidea avara]|uniref:septin-2-like n=1 Tax=Dysidea avara TaxID=196820 RepID=UPI003320010A
MSSAVHTKRILGPSGRTVQPKGRIGFANLPDQLVNRVVSYGFDFNILCVGETGVGKSTLMETLFKSAFDDVPVSHKQPEVSLTQHSYELREGNVNLRLTLVSTTGFGDQLSRESSAVPIVNYIDKQFEAYLQEELKIRRNLVDFRDTRVHVCVYFINPTGHSLKSLDLLCMKELDKRVNIIPVIAKADTISRPDLIQFKKQIMQELGSNGIKIYTFPTNEEQVGELNAKMNDYLPFGVVGSREEIIAGGKRIRARQYPWGIVEVENEAHCELTKLREMLIRTNMEDLREKTHEVHYQLYRSNRMTGMGFSDVSADNKPISLEETYQQKRNEHLKEMHTREEHMRAMFVQKVKEKEADLKSAEQVLIDDQDRTRQKHAEEKRALEEQRLLLEEEITQFNKRKAQVQAQRAQTEIMANNKPAVYTKSGKK